MTIDYAAMGDLIRLERMRRGWSQREVAEQVGVARSYIGKIEEGAAPTVAMGVVLALSDVLEIPLSELVGIDGIIPDDVGEEYSEVYDALSTRRRMEWLALGKTLLWLERSADKQDEFARIMSALQYDELYHSGRLVEFLNKFIRDVMGAGENPTASVETLRSVGHNA